MADEAKLPEAGAPLQLAESALRDSEERLRAILQTAVEGINTIDLVVEETGMSLDMDPEATDQQPYGIPVSAKLAVALMADFQNLIQPVDQTEQDELKKLLPDVVGKLNLPPEKKPVKVSNN